MYPNAALDSVSCSMALRRRDSTATPVQLFMLEAIRRRDRPSGSEYNNPKVGELRAGSDTSMEMRAQAIEQVAPGSWALL